MSASKEHYHNEIETGMRNVPGPFCPEDYWNGDKEPETCNLEPATRNHKIQWLNLPGYKGETWNPIIGCSKVSDGCKNCYAEKMAMRLQHMPQASYYSDVLLFKPIHDKKGWAGNTSFVESQIDKPAKWKTPRVVFVCSMGDLFHESTSFDAIEAVFSVMASCPQHIFIVLTKRPYQMFDFYIWKSGVGESPWQPSDNIWIGVTAENQAEANNRIAFLNCIYAAVKFVSVEPMLSEVDLNMALEQTLKYHAGGLKNCLSWVICGGESGHHARPLHPDWVRSLRDQCERAGVPFFFKQWGEWRFHPQTDMRELYRNVTIPPHDFKYYNEKMEPVQTFFGPWIKCGKKAAGNLLDGVKWENYPRDFTPAIKDDFQSMISNQSSL